MSFAHRALLYVIRRRTNTLILFLILLVVTGLGFTGMAIKAATGTAELNVRQALGGVFTLEQNSKDPSKWKNKNVSGSMGSGMRSYYVGTPLTTKLGDYIVSNTQGILGYNASYVSHNVPRNSAGDYLDLIKGKDEDSRMNSMLDGMGEFGKTVANYASSNSAYDSYFVAGYLKLVEGRHIQESDGNVALISKQLAEKNGLKVGDKISLRQEDRSGAKGMGVKVDGEDENAKPAPAQDVEIVGLYEATSKSSATMTNWSMDNSIYTTLGVVDKVQPNRGEEGYTNIVFHVGDPAALQGIVDKVKSLHDVDPSDFVINTDTSESDSVVKPLENMNTLVTALIILILVVGAAVLYLVLSNRVKDRVRESGILLSLGVGKARIIAQYCVEVTMVAIVSVVLAVFGSGFIAQAIGNSLLNYSVSQAAKTPATQAPNPDGGMMTQSGDVATPKFQGVNHISDIHVSISPETIALLSGITLGIIVLSVTLAALPILRLKPREILSKMS